MDNLARIDDELVSYEIINGRVVMMSPRPRINHARVSLNISLAFGNYLKGKKCKPFLEVDVHLDKKNHFTPDVIIVCDRDKVKPTHIAGAPDLVVEILSPRTTFRDRVLKMEAYEKFGVREYWIVNVETRTIEVYRNVDGSFEVPAVYHLFSEEEREYNESLPEFDRAPVHDEIPVGIYDDFFIPLTDIFEF